MNRWPLLCAVLLATLDTVTAAGTLRVRQNKVAEWRGTSRAAHADPFNEITLDALVTLTDGSERRVPTFWAGRREWRFRCSSPTAGRFPLRTIHSDTNDTGIHDRRGVIEVSPYGGKNPLLRHGPTHVRCDGGRFWVLGLKTEKAGAIVEVTHSGRAEILGGYIYGNRGRNLPDGTKPNAFINIESSLSVCGIAGDNSVEETRGGQAKTGSTGGGLYVGRK